MVQTLFLVCALALPTNKQWQYKFLANLAEDYGADKIIFRRNGQHKAPADSERMPFIWNGFLVYFKKAGWHLSKEERDYQFLSFMKYLRENSPDHEFVFLEKGLPFGPGWKRVNLEWEGYRIFTRSA